MKTEEKISAEEVKRVKALGCLKAVSYTHLTLPTTRHV